MRGNIPSFGLVFFSPANLQVLKRPWFLVGTEGLRALDFPFKGLSRGLIPSFPSLNPKP